MNLKLNGVMNTLSERVKKWPKWLQYSLGAFIVIMALMLFLTSSPSQGSTNLSDPFGNSFSILMDIILKLGIVVILIFVSALVYRRWRPGGSTGSARHLDLVETLQLGPKRTLYVVRAGDQNLLIGATDQSISLISELTPPDNTETVSLNPSARQVSTTAEDHPAFSDLLAISIDHSKDLDR